MTQSQIEQQEQELRAAVSPVRTTVDVSTGKTTFIQSERKWIQSDTTYSIEQ